MYFLIHPHKHKINSLEGFFRFEFRVFLLDSHNNVKERSLISYLLTAEKRIIVPDFMFTIYSTNDRDVVCMSLEREKTRFCYILDRWFCVR